MELTNIRNMDNQGRIVIPSEIRKRLHITGGDSLEIRSNGQDIRLRKCDVSASHDPQFQKFLTILYDSIRHGVFLCDTETVYSAKGIYLPDGTPIPKELSDVVADGKETVFNLNHPIYIVPYIKEPVAALFPISSTNASPLALVILCRHQEPLSELERGSAKLVAATMTRHLI